MSYLITWLSGSLAGLLYWGVVHDFASSQIDHFTGPFWFGGMALLMHRACFAEGGSA